MRVRMTMINKKKKSSEVCADSRIIRNITAKTSPQGIRRRQRLPTEEKN